MTESRQLEASVREVSLENLFLDPNNYRIIHENNQVEVADDQVKNSDVSTRTFGMIVGKKNRNIHDLIESFKVNGYLPVDQIQVRLLDNENYIVVEGNRRVATLKYLYQAYDADKIDLGKLDKSLFENVPVVLYEDPDAVHHLTIMALKHISGNRKWGEWNQATLLHDMRFKHNLSEEEVYKRVGINKTELRRILRALSLIEQYKKSDYGDQFTETLFPLFREAAQNTSIKEWLKWDESSYRATDVINTEMFFSLLSEEPIYDDYDDNKGIGSVENVAITKRDEIRTFGKILRDPKALEELEASRNINAAYRASNIIFSEKLESAVKAVSTDVSTLSQLNISQEHLAELETSFGRLRGVIEKARSISFKSVEHSSLFFDRIDHHFSSIKINAYRGLKNITLDSLSRINLFAGINNCGKTSILEAVYLLSKQNDFNGLADVLRRRGKISEDQLRPKWVAEQVNAPISLEGIFDNKLAKVNMQPLVEESNTIDRNRYLKSVEITTEFGDNKQESLTRMFQGKERETQADSIKQLCYSIFSSPFYMNEPHHYTSFYHKSVQSKSLPKIFAFIKDKVVPTLQDIRLVDEFQRFLVDDDCFDDAVDLTSYGEGLQRIFFTSLLFASAENGVVLIDEFENAIHADLIGTFVPFIYELSKEFNVQVFLTSHSKECIDAFVKMVPESVEDDYSFHAMVSDHDNAISLRDFKGNEYAGLVRVANVDLRRAR